MSDLHTSEAAKAHRLRRIDRKHFVINGVRWVRQEDSNGCVLASLAMITGKTYAEVKAGFVDWDGGISLLFDGFTYLAEHGYAVAPKYIHYHPLKQNRDSWPVEPFADVHLCEVITSRAHAVVLLRDGTVLDPNTPARKQLSEYVKVNVVAGIVPLPALNFEAVA